MTKRIVQVNQLIRKEVSQIILKEFECPPNVLVTVTRVDASPNLQQAKVFVSCIPEDKIDTVIKFLSQDVYNIQQKLNHRLNMRPVPRIQFVKEEETVRAGRVEEILERIKRKST